MNLFPPCLLQRLLYDLNNKRNLDQHNQMPLKIIKKKANLFVILGVVVVDTTVFFVASMLFCFYYSVSFILLDFLQKVISICLVESCVPIKRGI